MTPPHGVDLELKDSDPRLSAVPEKELDEGVSKPTSEKEQAHYFRCTNEPGGPVHELKKEIKAVSDSLTAVTNSFIAMRATFRTWARIGSGLLAILALVVSILTYVQSRKAQATATVIPHAHAEVKGVSP